MARNEAAVNARQPQGGAEGGHPGGCPRPPPLLMASPNGGNHKKRGARGNRPLRPLSTRGT
eukprot:10415964-Lingulodinium_polyedra.AAC.1